MKKIIIIIVLLVMITACSINLSDIDNTPTKKVEAFFNRYQTLDEAVLDDLDLVVEKETELTEKQKSKYRNIMKKHYQNLQYTIKEETVNGDSAIVEVEILVTDFNKELNKKGVKKEKDFYEEGQYNTEEYNDYRLSVLEKANEVTKYTLYLSLEKDDNDEWTLKDLTDEDDLKILGMYND